MANTTPSIYMNLPVPVPTADPGPQYATDLNSCLTTIDAHTHSSGSGQQITPAGISINQNLAFFNNNAISLRSVRFQIQNTPISAPSDLDCVYVSGVDLYYNDNNGNQVRLTQNGGVAGTPGSIGGLVSPASVNYVSGSQTFVFQSSTATPANLDCGAITIRNIVANSKGITIAPPAGLANNYSVSFPAALPNSGIKFLTIDSSGNMADVYGVDNSTVVIDTNNNLGVKNFSISPTQLKSQNVIASSSCGDFSISSATTAVITNLSAQISLSGLRSVLVTAIHDGTANPAEFTVNRNPISGAAAAQIWVMKDGALQAKYQTGSLTVNSAVDGTLKIANLVNHYDIVPTSGTFTYSLRVFNSAQVTNINRWKLVVMEQ